MKYPLLVILIIAMLMPLSLWAAQDNTGGDNSKQDVSKQVKPGEDKGEDNGKQESVVNRQPEKSINLKPDPIVNIPDSDSISFVKSLMALCFVLGLIFLVAYFFKRITGMKSTGFRANRVPISMVGNFPLGEKRYLAVMEIQDKHYFIGITQNSIRLLSQLDLDLEDIRQESPQDFENIFQKARMLLTRSPGANVPPAGKK